MTEQPAQYITTPSNGRVSVQEVNIRQQAYRNLIQATLKMCAAIYELTTGEKAPYYRDVLAK